jgi:hypothetical protein
MLRTADAILRDSWLFVNGRVSVRVVRSAPLEISICGPGPTQRTVTTASRQDQSLFLRLHAEALIAEGFAYEGFRAERRWCDEPRRTERRLPAFGPRAERGWTETPKARFYLARRLTPGTPSGPDAS